ncbi:MAG TPA: hypothetical protein VFP27_19745 [Mycobacterium sp.]|nr:hypothetical protein [Mycobacterium sp.]
MTPAVCQWCVRTSERRTRVECTGPRRYGVDPSRPCGHQWFLELSPHCLVCGSHNYQKVRPTRGDVPGMLGDLAALIEDLAHVHPLAAASLDAALGVVKTTLAPANPAPFR